VSTVPYKMQATQPSERTQFSFCDTRGHVLHIRDCVHLPSTERNVRVKIRLKILAGLILCRSLLLLCSCQLLQHY
jgi:hypothetical protein